MSRPCSTMGMVRRLVVLLAVVATAAGLLTSCNRSKVEGEGRLDPDGRILLTRDAKPSTVSRSRSLAKGDTIEVAEGTAKVTLPGGDVLDLRPRSVLVLDRGPDLRSGTMLVTAEGAPRTVRAAGSQIEASGAVRLDVTLALRVAVYGGYAVVRTGPRTFDIAALREASVPVVGVLQARPLAIARDDAWDQRFFGDAARKEPDLESRARGFTGQVSASDARSLAYYRDLLPALRAEQAFQQNAVERLGRPPAAGPNERLRAGEVLLGSAIALLGKRGTFADRLERGGTFRSEGASWAVVALDQQVPSIDELLKLVDGAVNVAPLELAAPGSPSPPIAVVEPPPARATTTTAPPRRTTTTTTTRPVRATPTTTSPTPPPPQAPPPAPSGTIVLPVDPLLDALTDPVIDLLNSLLGNPPR
jgi:hypothetical protein